MTSAAENTEAKQRGRPFKPGKSGNPAGKPKGARHKTTLAVQALLDGEAENITRKAIKLAQAGDMTAIRLVLERIAPLRKGQPVTLSLPPINTTHDLVKALSSVVASMAAGELTPDEAAIIAGVLELKRRAIETTEIETRLSRLEQEKQA